MARALAAFVALVLLGAAPALSEPPRSATVTLSAGGTNPTGAEVAEPLPAVTVGEEPAVVTLTSGQEPVAEVLDDASPCELALATVEAAGLHVPPGWSFACPAPAWGLGREHRGRTCLIPCFGSPGLTVEVNPALSPNLLGVVAHELCHAWDYHLVGDTTEPAADRCAAEWGFPNG